MVKIKYKILTFIFSTVIILCAASFSSAAHNIGDVVGCALKTDIAATINGYDIPSYNINGQTYVIVEDLKFYGFTVRYDNDSRSLSVTRDFSQSWVGKTYSKPPVSEKQIGIPEHNLLYTDIVTYLDGYYTPSCNINGQTIIRFSDLNKYGEISFDNNKREAALLLPGLNHNPLDTFIDKMGVTVKNRCESDYVKMGYNTTCNVRTNGNSLVFGFVFDDYAELDDVTKESMQSGVEKSIAQYKSSLSLYKTSIPEITSIVFNYYEGDGDIIVSVSSEL